MMEQQQEYQIAYTSPPIEKMATDYMLPAMEVDDYCRETLNRSYLGVYFIQSAEGYIKIGKSSDVLKRLGSYRTHHPGMRMVGMISCAPKFLDYNENLLHRLWEPFIVSLEWFAPVRPLIEYLRNFDRYGFGFPMELVGSGVATWQDLLGFQKRMGEFFEKRGAR